MITSVARLRRIACALFALAPFVLFGAPWSTGQEVSAQSYVLFVSVVDLNGDPVTDLAPDELTVQWDGEDCETLDLERVSLPVRVTVLIDNAEDTRDALQNMREGLKGFVAAIPEDVEIGLLTLARQPRWITRHTSDRAELARGLDLVTPDFGTSARFLDGWVEAANRLSDDAERQYLPVILMLSGDGNDASTITQGRYADMRQKMIDVAATMHTRMFAGIGNVAASQAQMGMELGNLTPGSFESLATASTFLTQLPELGRDVARKHDRVTNQYRVTYTPPEGASTQPNLSIVTRPGLQLIPTANGNVP